MVFFFNAKIAKVNSRKSLIILYKQID